jgi:hypothetical protein
MTEFSLSKFSIILGLNRRQNSGRTVIAEIR